MDRLLHNLNIALLNQYHFLIKYKELPWVPLKDTQYLTYDEKMILLYHEFLKILPSGYRYLTQNHLDTLEAMKKVKEILTPDMFNYDDAVNYIINGPASFYLKKSDKAKYWAMIDLSHLGKYKVRKGVYQYGGKAYFSKNKLELICYEGVDYRDDPLIERIFFSSLCAQIFAVDHAMSIHFTSSQQGLVYFRNHVKITDKDFDIINLMTRNTETINSFMDLVIGKYGYLERVFGFDADVLDEIFNDNYAKGPMTRDEILGWKESQHYKHMSRYVKSVEKLFSALDVKDVGNKYPRRKLVDFFCLSSLHHILGNRNAIFDLTYGQLPSKVYKKKPYEYSINDKLITVAISLLISQRIVIFNSEMARNYFQGERRKIYSDWVESLAKISDDYFIPGDFEVSVGS